MSTSQTKVPWEPYKAAIKKSPSFGMNNNQIQKENLVRYKIDTDMNVFNSKRPGFDNDEAESAKSTSLAQEMVESSTDTARLPPSFIDARFYPDVNFLKLANQLKKKSLPSPPGTTPKPVNVVGPMIENKTNTNAYGADNNSIKLWKTQRNQYESRIAYLESQINGVSEQLQIQTEVNAELKKMLVASIGGEDLQYKMERLINDKLRYEHELTSNTKQIEKLNEEIEQISIQCDLWRSKFQASKVMAEENATWKMFLILLNQQNEKILKNVLKDNELLNEKLNEALEKLHTFKTKVDPNNTTEFKTKNLNNLQAINTLISKLNALNEHSQSRSTQSSKKSEPIRIKTINEIIAEQMLEQFDWLNAAVQIMQNKPCELGGDFVDSLDLLEQLVKRIKTNRLSKYGRLFQPVFSGDTDILLNICKKCTGQLKVV